MTDDLLTFSGFVTGSSFTTDPIVGADIVMSGSLLLAFAFSLADGTNVAEFEPQGTVTFSLGRFISGEIIAADYVETPLGGNRFNLTIANLVAGSQQSDFVDFVMTTPGLFGIPVLGLGIASPTSLFAAGSFPDFGPIQMENVIVPAVPEPGTTALFGLGVVGLPRLRHGRRPRGSSRFAAGNRRA
jgi:hypothetical protein